MRSVSLLIARSVGYAQYPGMHTSRFLRIPHSELRKRPIPGFSGRIAADSLALLMGRELSKFAVCRNGHRHLEYSTETVSNCLPRQTNDLNLARLFLVASCSTEDGKQLDPIMLERLLDQVNQPAPRVARNRK